MSVTIYRDDLANAIFIEDSNGVQFLNSLQAYLNDPVDTTLHIKNTAIDIDIFTAVAFQEFVDREGDPYGSTCVETINNLNAIFQDAGSGTGTAPVITSPTSLTVSDGESLNYLLTATGGVGYEWANLPVGLAIANGNPRNLLGSVASGPGTYTPTMTAVNYFGQDSETLTITVTSSFANTRSIQFGNQNWMDASASGVASVLSRPANGSGPGDAWTISLWFKPSSSSNNSQTILYYGDSDTLTGGNLSVTYQGGNDRIEFQYGSSFDNLTFISSDNSINPGQWHNILLTYDGGTTGSASGSVSDYYGRFDIFINGVSAVSSGSWSNTNFGWSSSIGFDNFRVGRHSLSGYMRNGCVVDEIALWNGDQTPSVSAIYNSGAPHDLGTLGSPPDHWWRMGDGDTFPTVQDKRGSVDFTMFNMTSADIINDTP